MPTPADLLAAARRYRGVPYLYGGKTPAALDCSGLISLACRDVGVTVPAGSSAQIAACTPISVDEARTTPGITTPSLGRVSVPREARHGGHRSPAARRRDRRRSVHDRARDCLSPAGGAR